MGGCLSKSETKDDAGSSKPAESKPAPAPTTEAQAKPAEPAAVDNGDAAAAKTEPETKLAPAKIYIVYYSTYGHVETMARTMAEALNEAGAHAKCWQVPETLPEVVLEKMSAPAKPKDHPIITAEQLVEADALVFAFPTRFGTPCAQMKQFLDSTGSLWQKGQLAGKPATMMVSTASQGGGQETTIMTAVSQLVHHGMIFIPMGYTAPDLQMGNEEVRGGGPWGAGTFADANGTRRPSKLELEVVKRQAQYFVKKASKLANLPVLLA